MLIRFRKEYQDTRYESYIYLPGPGPAELSQESLSAFVFSSAMEAALTYCLSTAYALAFCSRSEPFCRYRTSPSKHGTQKLRKAPLAAARQRWQDAGAVEAQDAVRKVCWFRRSARHCTRTGPLIHDLFQPYTS